MYKILIWGTGKIANTLMSHITNSNIIGFIESSGDRKVYQNYPVFSPSKLDIDYDYIIVANSHSFDVKITCDQIGIDPEKIIFLRTAKYNPGTVSLGTIKELFDDYQYTLYCAEHAITEETFFEKDADTYERMNSRSSFAIEKINMWPVLNEKYATAGQVNNYFIQDLWAAKLINKSGIKEHFDIGSRLDGFIAHLLAMHVKVTMIDVRRFPCEIEGLSTIVSDATLLSNIPNDSIESMSALCSLEHFGLGRYGDPIDPEACFKCFDSISTKMKRGGNLYISVPIGKERVEFNAHRVFYAETIISAFSAFELAEFACASEQKIEYDVDIHKYDNDPHNGEFRYGLFYFVKK